MPDAKCLRCNATVFWRNQRGSTKPDKCKCGGLLVARMSHPEDIGLEIERQKARRAEMAISDGPDSVREAVVKGIDCYLNRLERRLIRAQKKTVKGGSDVAG